MNAFSKLYSQSSSNTLVIQSYIIIARAIGCADTPHAARLCVSSHTARFRAISPGDVSAARLPAQYALSSVRLEYMASDVLQSVRRFEDAMDSSIMVKIIRQMM